jgi:hypothetical protein
MDLLWFLQRRLRFTHDLYHGATSPFRETLRQIEAGEPPFVDARDPENGDTDPPFLDEYQRAAEAIEVIGHWCLCMVFASCKAYLEECVDEMARDYRGLGDLRQILAQKKAKSWFERYRLLFLEELGIDWEKGPVKLADLEHMNLARDDLTHNVEVMSMYVYQTESHAQRYPKGRFVDDLWTRLGLGGRIKVGPEELTAAITVVDEFCRWLEDIRLHYPKHVRGLVCNGPVSAEN